MARMTAGINPDEFITPQSRKIALIINDIVKSRYPSICVSGPLGTSKTSAIWYAINLICTVVPDARVAIVRNEKATLATTIQATIKRMMTDGFAKTNGNVFDNYGGENRPQELHYKSGSVVFFGGSDDSSKVLGFEPNFLFYNQADRAKESDVKDLESRLRGNGGFTSPRTGKKTTLMVLDANPQGPRHWILKRVRSSLLRMYDTILKDNVFYYRDQAWTDEGLAYKERLDIAYPDDDFQRARYVDGKWVAPEGLVFPMVTDATHFRDIRFDDIPSDWICSGSIDYGTTSAAAITYNFHSPDREKVIAFKAVYKSGMTTDDYDYELRRLVETYGKKPRVLYTDHDAAHNLKMRKFKWNIREAEKGAGSVIKNVDCAKLWLSKPGAVIFNRNLLDHKPDYQLVLNGACMNPLDEWFEVSYRPPEKQTGDSEKDDQPYSGTDHYVDAMMYYLAGINRKQRAIRPSFGDTYAQSDTNAFM